MNVADVGSELYLALMIETSPGLEKNLFANTIDCPEKYSVHVLPCNRFHICNNSICIDLSNLYIRAWK